MSIQELKDKILPVLRKSDVVKASLFGSIVNGNATKKSDVDLLVEFRGEKSLLDLSGLKIKLEKLLGRKVDVLTFKSIYPPLRKRILSEQEPVL